MPQKPVNETYRRGQIWEAGFDGHFNTDDALDLGDATAILWYLFGPPSDPPCQKAADLDDSGSVDIGDAINLLAFLFVSGPPPPAPFAACGVDTTPDDLTCDAFPPCR